jgi:hypothetical protein
VEGRRWEGRNGGRREGRKEGMKDEYHGRILQKDITEGYH